MPRACVQLTYCVAQIPIRPDPAVGIRLLLSTRQPAKPPVYLSALIVHNYYYKE